MMTAVSHKDKWSGTGTVRGSRERWRLRVEFCVSKLKVIRTARSEQKLPGKQEANSSSSFQKIQVLPAS